MTITRMESGSWLETTAGEARSARAFAAARRHSQLVRRMRAALLAGSCGAVAIIVGLALYRTFGPRVAGVSIGQMSVDGTKITMDKPRLTGVRQDGGGYVVNAAKAIQDITHPNQVELVTIDGEIASKDQGPSKLSAEAGRYDSAQETLDLSGLVRLRNTSYTIDMKNAHINFKTGVYQTSEPIMVIMSAGTTIVADSALARDNGSVLQFAGHVKTRIPPTGGGAGPAPQMKGDAP